MHDAALRAGGVCAEIGPPPEPGLRGYCCNLDVDHPGAHVASIAGEVIDTWPSAVSEL